MLHRDRSSTQRRFPSVVLVSVGLLLLAILVSQLPIVGTFVIRLVPPLLVTLVEAAAAVGLARQLRALLEHVLAPNLHSSFPLSFDLLVGLPFFGALSYLVGLLVISPWSSALLLAFGIILLVLARRRRAQTSAREPSSPPTKDLSPTATRALALDAPSVIAAGTLLIALGLALLMAMLPPFSIDELAYHLTVPWTWVKEGQVVTLPLNSQSYFPLGIEAADIPLLSLLGRRGGVASHLLHLISAIAASDLTLRWLRRWQVSPQNALVFLAALVSTPALLNTAGLSWNDWPLWGLCVAFIYAQDQRQPGAPLALALGGGMLIKYTFWAFAWPLLLGQILATWRSPLRRPLLITAAMGLGLGSLFVWRNLIETGNPLAPFFSSHAPHVENFRSVGNITELLLGYVGSRSLLDESLGITLLFYLLALLAVWRLLPTKEGLLRRALIALAILCVGLVMAPSARLLLPFLATASLEGVIGIDRLLESQRKLRALLSTGVLIAVGLQLLVVYQLVDVVRPLNVLLSKPPHDQRFLLRVKKRRHWALRFLDSRLPSNSRTLVLGLNELYYFDHQVRGAGNFDGARIAAYLTQASPKALHRRLVADGFTHVAIYWPGLPTAQTVKRRGFQAETVTPLSKATARDLHLMLKRWGRATAHHRYAAIYALSP